MGYAVEQLPKIMELVGLGYTGWFVYRYLLFKVTNVQQPIHTSAGKLMLH